MFSAGTWNIWIWLNESKPFGDVLYNDKNNEFDRRKLWKYIFNNNSNGLFYLSKGEWRFSIAKKDHYFIYVWIQDRTEPRIITYKELNSKFWHDVSFADNSFFATASPSIAVTDVLTLLRLAISSA